MPTVVLAAEVPAFFERCNQVLDEAGLCDRYPSSRDTRTWGEILMFLDVSPSELYSPPPVDSGKDVRDMQRIALGIAMLAPRQIMGLECSAPLRAILKTVIKVAQRRGYYVPAEYGPLFPWPAFRAWEDLAIARGVAPALIASSRAKAKARGKINGFYEE